MKSSDLKIIACITMLIDHIGAALLPEMILLRVIGRIAFPIFCFLLVEGFYHTKDVKKYMLRLGLFALAAELPFDLTFYKTPFYWQHQNIFFTLLVGVAAMAFFQRFRYVNFWVAVPAVPTAMLINTWIGADYGFYGIGMIMIFFFLHDKKPMHVVTVAMFNLLFVIIGSMSFLQIYAVLALAFIWFYNGERGLKLKYAFYVFYPGHLMLIWAYGNLIG